MSDVELLPLPEPGLIQSEAEFVYGYDREDMEAYARACVKADRATRGEVAAARPSEAGYRAGVFPGDIANPADVDGADSGEWYCERHPESLQNHDGCEGAGMPSSARIPMLVHQVRMLMQELRERDLQYGFLARANMAKLQDDLEWQAALTKAFLPYQERAVKAELEIEALRAERDSAQENEAIEYALRGAAEARAERLAEALRSIPELDEQEGDSLGNARSIARAALHPAATQEKPMKFEVTKDDATGTVRFKGEITKRDLTRLDLNLLDRATLASPRSASEALLALELIFRRHEERARG